MQIIDVILEYLKQYKFVQTNDYYLIGIVTLNHITVHELFALARITWNHINVQTNYHSRVKCDLKKNDCDGMLKI